MTSFNIPRFVCEQPTPEQKPLEEKTILFFNKLIDNIKQHYDAGNKELAKSHYDVMLDKWSECYYGGYEVGAISQRIITEINVPYLNGK